MSKVSFLYDREQDATLVAVILEELGLMIVVHANSLACFEVRPYVAAKYKLCPPHWKGAELRNKMLQWSERINDYVNAGIQVKVERARTAKISEALTPSTPLCST